jgi:hypothetical protein
MNSQLSWNQSVYRHRELSIYFTQYEIRLIDIYKEHKNSENSLYFKFLRQVVAYKPLSGETLVHIFVLVVSGKCTTFFLPLSININWVRRYIDI